jgi:hypothetical protein
LSSRADERLGDERRRLRLELGPALAIVGHHAREHGRLDLVLALLGALAELVDLGLLLAQLDQRFENRDIDGGAVSGHRSHTSSCTDFPLSQIGTSTARP